MRLFGSPRGSAYQRYRNCRAGSAGALASARSEDAALRRRGKAFSNAALIASSGERFRIKGAPPLEHPFVLGALRVAERFQAGFVARQAANILRRPIAYPGNAPRVRGARLGQQDRLEQRVTPPVAKVVVVFEPVSHAPRQMAQR